MNGASDQLLHLFSGYNQIAVLRCLLDLLMHVHLALVVSMFYLIEITTFFFCLKTQVVQSVSSIALSEN